MSPAAARDALERAVVLCRKRGVRLTDRRRRVLEILCSVGRPVGAYEILEAMRDGPRATAPPTVYRALEFLLAQGLVHKLESLHAFVGCVHPERPHASQFLICAECGGVAEIDDERVADSLQGAVQQAGFRPRRRVIELIGTCADCEATSTGR